jgi:N-acetylglutamate synthase-like GNAT family acetyltransferase
MNIRPARAEEQGAIQAMVRGAHLNPLDLNWRRFLVAEDESGILGVGQIRLHAGAPELASLVVRQDQRGNGIGGELIRALIAQSPGTLYLFCRGQLEGYYARFGFGAITVNQSPPALKTRYAIGRFIVRLLGRRMLLMKRGL